MKNYKEVYETNFKICTTELSLRKEINNTLKSPSINLIKWYRMEFKDNESRTEILS